MSRLPNIVSVPATFIDQEFPRKAQIQVSRAWLENLGYDVVDIMTKERPKVEISTPTVKAVTIPQVPQAKPQAEEKPSALHERAAAHIREAELEEEKELNRMIEEEEKESLTFSEKADQMQPATSGYSSNEEWMKKSEETDLTTPEPSDSIAPVQEKKVSKRLF
tara:strand:+ start:1669 stop:2160 length:492 start_codon:yes stop_codon:yes gene_type:complete